VGRASSVNVVSHDRPRRIVAFGDGALAGACARARSVERGEGALAGAILKYSSVFKRITYIRMYAQRNQKTRRTTQGLSDFLLDFAAFTIRPTKGYLISAIWMPVSIAVIPAVGLPVPPTIIVSGGTVIRAIVMAGPDMATAIILVMVTIAATIFVPIGLLQQAVRLARIGGGELDSCLVTKRCSAIGLGHRCCR